MKRLFQALIAGCVMASAQAADLQCVGTVTQLSYLSADAFMVQLSSMNHSVMFCSPEANWVVAGTGYTTGPNSCKMMYATFLSAQAQDLSLTLLFDGNDVPMNCNSWSPLKAANIRLFRF